MSFASRVSSVALAALAVALVTSGVPVAGAADPAPAKVIALAKSTVARLGTAPEVVKAVKAQNAKATTLAEVQAHDKKWMSTPGVADFMKALIESECGAYLKKVQAGAPYYSELFVTDKLGANVAMTGKTSDFWQGDEPKFTESWKDGAGAIYVSDVAFDKSTQAYVVHVSVPVKDGPTTIGVLVAGISIEKVS